MEEAGKTDKVFQSIECSDALERFLSSDEGAGSGYGVAAYVGTSFVICSIYDLQTNELLATLQKSGDFASLSGTKLKNTLADVLDELAEQAQVSLSKINVAVVSGTTAMESKVAGLEQPELLHDLEEELGEFGRDVEYMLAGSNSIAVGQAYFVPCLAAEVGGDVICNLLAIDILGADKPQLIVNTGSRGTSGIVLVYGSKDKLSVCVVPDGVSTKDAMGRLLDVCQAELGHIERMLVSGDVDVEVPSELSDKAQRVPDVAIEGTSAVLLSEAAEDELCRIVSSCNIIEV